MPHAHQDEDLDAFVAGESGHKGYWGNMRAYTSLEPCHKNGDGCESGADCCGGFCRWQETGDASDPVATCVPPPVGCSNVDESCQTSADCCGASRGETCINKRCAAPNVYLQ
jgi:hypothetical protein